MTEAAPDLLRVEEAAAALRIGRTAAYLLARRYLSGDPSGLPVVRVGRLLRVPRAELETMTGGKVSWPPPERATSSEAGDRQPDRRSPSTARRHRPIDERRATQLSLLETD